MSNNGSPDRMTESRRGWNEIIGPFYKFQSLPDEIRSDEGLIVLDTERTSRVCPVGQFNIDQNSIHKNDGIVLELDEWLGFLWRISKDNGRSQSRCTEWTVAASLLTLHPGMEESYAERLFSASEDVEKEKIVMEYLALTEEYFKLFEQSLFI